MAAPNGTLTPPEPMPVPESTERTSNKRKREDEDHDQVTQKGRDEVSLRSVETQKDILEILQQYGQLFVEDMERADIL
jgi:hypothetical protein